MAGPSIPGYEGLTQIGSGGFSRVYQAQQAKLKRDVAIKVLNFGLNDEADRRSFERECELMGRVSTHPNIVTVHDTEFTSEGHPCIVMEHYPGGSLADFIGEVGQLQVREALEVGVSIAAALEASHQAKVLHCDLKPQNILISEFGQPALGDFGISTFAEERTYTGTDAGAGFTLAYAAPEILEGASPSITADVYSLAATLYTALAGRRPFFFQTAAGERPTPSEQARRILLETAPPLAEFGVPAEVDALIASAMSKDPELRPQSAADFAVALYEVGTALGLNTSMPRIASQAALRGRLPAQNPEAPESVAPAAPIIDMTQLTQVRAKANPPPHASVAVDVAEAPLAEVPLAEAPLAEVPLAEVPLAEVPLAEAPLGEPAPPTTRLPSEGVRAPDLEATEARVAPDPVARAPQAPAATAPPAQPTSTVASAPPAQDPRTPLDDDADSGGSRKWMAALFAAGSLAAVVAVLVIFSGGGSDPAAEPTAPPTAVAGVAVDPVIAPNQPTNVELIHMDGGRALVRWTVTGGVEPDSDISYEVRRQGDETNPLLTSGAWLLLDDVRSTEATCVTLLAVRSNRTSAPTRPACLGPAPAAAITLTPGECALPCSIEFAVEGEVAGDPQVRVVDQFNREGFADVDLAAGTIAVAREPGVYAVIAEWPDQRVAVVLEVAAGSDP